MMSHFGAATLALLVVSVFLILCVGAVALGIALAEIYAIRRERRNLRRVISQIDEAQKEFLKTELTTEKRSALDGR